MKIFLISACLLFMPYAPAGAQSDKPKDASSLFYKASSYYEQGDFQKALEVYGEISKRGLMSANLYYNMGNAYFKLGSLGRAVLYYERARALLPQDADLKANLEYAQSLAEEQLPPTQKMWLIKFLDNLTGQFSLDALTIFVSALYSIIALLLAIGMIYRERLKNRLFIPLSVITLAAVMAAASFAVRAYEREFLKPAIIISEETSCRFEPFDESTVYFKIREGSKVFVLLTKTGWSKIRRLDGKTAWVRNDAIEII